MNILVVEDEKKHGGFLRTGLKAQGFVVDFCDNGDKGYAFDRTRTYDAIVLDLTVPGRNGLSILRNLRDQHARMPVILLTARTTI